MMRHIILRVAMKLLVLLIIFVAVKQLVTAAPRDTIVIDGLHQALVGVMGDSGMYLGVASIALSILTLIILARQYKLGKSQLSDGHEYSRRMYAMQLVENWDRDIFSSRQAVLRKWQNSFDTEKFIDFTEIEACRKKQIAELEANAAASVREDLITDSMAKIVNYFEVISIAVLNKVADESILYYALHAPMKRWYHILADYRSHVREKRGYNPWRPLDELYVKWFDDPLHYKLPTGASGMKAEDRVPRHQRIIGFRKTDVHTNGS